MEMSDVFHLFGQSCVKCFFATNTNDVIDVVIDVPSHPFGVVHVYKFVIGGLFL